MSPSVVRAAFTARWRRENVVFQGCVGELRRRDAADARAGLGVVGEVGRARPAWRSRVLTAPGPSGSERARAPPHGGERTRDRQAGRALPGPSRGVSTKAGSGDGWLAITVSW